MKTTAPATKFSLWRTEQLYNIDFASYALSHHSFSRHFHDHYVIELVTKGVDNFYCDGRNYTAQNDQLVLINPGEVHTGNTVSDIPLHYYSLYPGKKELEQVAAILGISLPVNFCFQRSLVDSSLLTQKLRLFFDSLGSGQVSLQQQEIFFDCMYELLQPASRNNHQSISCHSKNERIQLLTGFIRSHFKENISLQQLSGLVSLDPFHLTRLFKKAVGVSLYEYLLIIRTEHARQLLRKGLKVREAAVQSGFYDSSHFNRIFYKMNGASPKSFRSSKSQYCTRFAEQ
ncbi:MAG: AraC family transcriptional regulator [Bacteroidota bacterium]|nr:AraC family transcriptional regulator [Bacteroidota bacterium]